MNEIKLSEFPSTRYQGSKRKILPWIHSVVKDLEFETVLDAFGGSSSVSYLFKKMNKSVTFNDNLTFNYHIGKALIENKKVLLTEEDIADLTKRHSYVEYEKFIQETFEDSYYLNSENAWLDKVVCNINQMNHYRGNVLDYKKSLAYYALFQSSLIKRPFNLFHRKNLYIRTSDVKRNFGNKSTWEGSFLNYLRKFAKEANSLVFDSGKECISLNESAFDISPEGYDLVYLDPPYLRNKVTNESSNYFKCYHFLEGIVNYDDWHSMIDYDTINKRLKASENINDFDLKTIHKTYEQLIYHYRKSTIVLSYKKGGAPSIEYLFKLMKKIKGNAFTRSKHYYYALNHQNGDAEKNREVIIVGI